jgi:hypothetical protein
MTTLPAEISAAGRAVVAASVEGLLAQIRPDWQAKLLIERVRKLLPVDPSSACQRLLNAAIHDLREKIVIAGIDVAAEAASLNKLPAITRPEDVYEYSTTYTLDLCYHMGLTNRAEWRRLKRAYEIRKDLEHEDDQYEAGLEDCVYVFGTCIDIVLARDPIRPVRVTDFKDVIESPAHIVVSTELTQDYTSAPDKRQTEIMKFLISTARDFKKPDIVRQNAIEVMLTVRPVTRRSVQAEIGEWFQELLQKTPIELTEMKIAAAGGFSPYLKQAKVRDFMDRYFAKWKAVGYEWNSHSRHPELFDGLDDIGGLTVVPGELRSNFIRWMVLCYIGDPARGRVYHSWIAAPRIYEIFKKNGALIREDFDAVVSDDSLVKSRIKDQQVARRLEDLRDAIIEMIPSVAV